MKSKPHFSTLSSEKVIAESDAHRAIYIDFEGFTDKTPSLIGIQCDEEFEQKVLTDDLALAAAAKSIKVADGKVVIASLLSRAKLENRKIVAYSSFEKEQCHKWFGIDISEVYVNANLVAKRWKKLAHPKLRITGLKDYLKLVNYPRGDHLGIKQSTQRIASVSNMLAKKGNFIDLTPVVKAKWTKLLDHNKIDVQGMKFLILQTFINKK